ncbi:hypothetical protein A1OW_19295 [Enterovibrio norvegicus]|uniref:Uncharacterized protein n=2 Tax=Enterovibrio norvegicus TaxID=188144 RepID=A0A1I5KQD6_9GAMM|nr:hypothetical protein [Enterovibrio norvegicus]OEF56491.1 hypothetical protein A1OU_17185 [Enterovibrio norvegicus]OEF62157.1 hypothetical protein A1OW_19295 [Enterovibrio norvegicus]PMH61019.1 hypothetical protein BCU62_20740 [Enterovibrio norvegicus]SFO86906.1 hypothetical protein SAMN03084138_00695 [Enterovibrio norvegicus DSM 15893]
MRLFVKALARSVTEFLKSMGSTLSKWSKDLDAYDKQAKQMRREDRLGEVDYSAQEDLTSKTSKQNEDELREQ